MDRPHDAADVLPPAARPATARRSLTVEQCERLLLDAIPADRRPAMWLTALMCGLRPGELAGLRWPYVDIDSNEPSIDVAERVLEVDKRYVGQAEPKTAKGRRRIGLDPLLVAALHEHREDMEILERYDPDGFVFCTHNGTPMSIANLRRGFGQLCERRSFSLLRGSGYFSRHAWRRSIRYLCR